MAAGDADPSQSDILKIGILELIEDLPVGERLPAIEPSPPPGVLVDQVVRKFGDRVVLDHLDLVIEAKELVVLLGPPRCGKSTLLRLLAGLDRPDGGSVEVPAARAIVFQADRLLPWQRVVRNVPSGLRGPDADGRARAVVREVGPAGRTWLADGASQRASLADALVIEPELVLLDEPFTALDIITRWRMYDLVRALRHDHDAAMLLVTHDIDEAIALADRIDVMGDGRIGSSYAVTLSASDRAVGVAREALRSALLADLGFVAR